MIAGHLEAEDGHRYHLDPEGDDRSGDGSASFPWRSLARLAAQRLGPGDTVLLRAGAEFVGSLEIGPGQGGDAHRPLVIASNGEGRARIRAAADAPAIRIHDTGCIELHDLDLRGPGGALSHCAGIEMVMEGARPCAHIRLARIEITGFAIGVDIRAAASARSGFEDLVLDHVDSHANGACGIRVATADPAVFHRRVSIAHCRCWDNGDGALSADASGAGMLLGGIENGRVEYCEARGNGAQQHTPSATCGIGIRCWQSRGVTVQRCIAHHNRSGGSTAGGGGFELAAGAQDCVLQYVYAYANDGPGIALIDGVAGALRGNLIRFVLSQGDAARAGGAALSIASTAAGIAQTLIHNATIYLSSTLGDAPVALRVSGAEVSGLCLDGNVFMSAGGPLLHCDPVAGLRLRGNAYAAPPARLHWAGTWYADPAAWLAAVAQERCDDRGVAVCGELLLERPGKAAPLADPQSLGALVAYRPQPGSPLGNGGLEPAQRGYSLGGRDLCGLPLADEQRLIGAFAPEKSKS